MGVYVHVCCPRPTDYLVLVRVCPDCKTEAECILLDTPWYGSSVTCMNCGRNWQDGEWMRLPFCRGAREASIQDARRRLAGLRAKLISDVAPIWRADDEGWISIHAVEDESAASPRTRASWILASLVDHEYAVPAIARAIQESARRFRPGVSVAQAIVDQEEVYAWLITNFHRGGFARLSSPAEQAAALFDEPDDDLIALIARIASE